MRIQSDAGTIYGTREAALGEGRRVDFVESAEPGDLAAGIARIAKELAAESPARSWVLPFIDLAGVVTNGLSVGDLGDIVAMASQSEALARAAFATERDVVAEPDLFFEASQSFLAGTSSGTRFVTASVGELELED